MKQSRSPVSSIWLGYLVLGVINFIDALFLSLLGGKAEQATILRVLGRSWSEIVSNSPRLAEYLNNLIVIMGLLYLGFSFFIIATSLTGYRKGERWAWYSMWFVSIYYSLTALILWSEGEIFSSDALSADLLLTFLVASLIFQLVSIPKFFSKQSINEQS